MAVLDILLWLVVIALAASVFALARQIGLLHERLPGVGALVTSEGPALGELAPRMTLMTSGGEAIELGIPRATPKPMLLLFVSTACPVCKKILPWLDSFARSEQVDLALFGESAAIDIEQKFRQLVGPATAYVGDSATAAMSFRVGKLPYAVMLDAAGRVAAKGLVNSREHLESLLVSTELGVRTLQEHFSRTQGAAHAN
jgi:methylamine dehydrogenase accessory protein MauD